MLEKFADEDVEDDEDEDAHEHEGEFLEIHELYIKIDRLKFVSGLSFLLLWGVSGGGYLLGMRLNIFNEV